MRYDGEFRNGHIEGEGILRDKLTMKGTFANDRMTKGTIQNDGRSFQVDIEAGSIKEIMPDGSKRSLDTLPDGVHVRI